MGTKEDKDFVIIMGYVETVCSIQCLKCNKTESDWETDDYYFAKKLIKNGWTYRHEKVLCPECAKGKPKK